MLRTTETVMMVMMTMPIMMMTMMKLVMMEIVVQVTIIGDADGASTTSSSSAGTPASENNGSSECNSLFSAILGTSIRAITPCLLITGLSNHLKQMSFNPVNFRSSCNSLVGSHAPKQISTNFWSWLSAYYLSTALEVAIAASIAPPLLAQACMGFGFYHPCSRTEPVVIGSSIMRH